MVWAKCQQGCVSKELSRSVEAASEAPSGALDVVGEGFQRESRVWDRSDGTLDAVLEG